MMSIIIRQIRCEYRKDPIGIGTRLPRFSFRLDADTPRDMAATQTAYRIGVASTRELTDTGRFDLWDSGMVADSRTVSITYAGKRLQSRQRCYYRVYSQLNDGRVLESSIHTFETGLLYRRDFTARFIYYTPPCLPGGEKGTFSEGLPSPMLRRSFNLEAPAVKARLYCTALGLYNQKVNGVAVSEDRLTPGWTNYDRMLQYQTYDVAPLLRVGDNCLTVILGDGWYAGCVGLFGRGFYSTYPLGYYCQLEIALANRKTIHIGSDKHWKYAFGPYRQNDLMLGEVYDATMELPGWEEHGFDDGAWMQSNEYNYSTSPLHGDFVAQINPPIRINQTLRPITITEIKPDRYIVDMGQNIAGWTRLTVRGKRGQRVVQRFGEMLQEDGTLYTENLRQAKATDVYICRGDGREVYEPLFTFHGFRYVEITGLGYRPEPGDIIGCVVYSAMETTGSFVCGDEGVNRLFANVLWSQKGNFLDVPTDCPQRDERLGWTGDGHVFCATACYNMDAAAFYTKWMQDIALCQRLDGSYPDVAPYVNLTATAIKHTKNADSGNPVWAEVGIALPYTLYLFYQDTRVLADHYAGMERYMAYLQEDSENFLRQELGFGDWLSVKEKTPNRVVGTAFYAYAAHLMAQISRILGKGENAAYYEALFLQIRDAFTTAFIDPQKGIVWGDTQTGYLLTLRFKLVEGALEQTVFRRLLKKLEQNEGLLACGFVGISYLLPVLSHYGRDDVAYRLLLEERYPSWLYPVRNGATTIWERWDSYTIEDGFGDVGMNSFNHYSLGSVAQWIYQYVGGIRPTPDAGFRRMTLSPRPDPRLGHADVGYRSMVGEIRSAWKYGPESIVYTLTIPANAMAELRLLDTGEVLSSEVELTHTAQGYTGVLHGGRHRIEITHTDGGYSID